MNRAMRFMRPLRKRIENKTLLNNKKAHQGHHTCSKHANNKFSTDLARPQNSTTATKGGVRIKSRTGAR